jgi:hypothetical protein
MLATAIFAIAVLALGRCVENCMMAELLTVQDALARRALASRMAEIEAGAVRLEPGKRSWKLGDGFPAMEGNEEIALLKLRNEKDEEVGGLFDVILEVKNERAGIARSLRFYASQKNL